MDKLTFTRAVSLYKDTVFRVALHSLGSPADADDAVQEVFLKLYTYKKSFDSDMHLRNWLLRVTVNFCKDMLKSPWRKRRLSLQDMPDEPAFQKPQHTALYRAVMSLPEKYRTVLYLFYYEELSVREIGETLKIGQSAVTTRLSRARAMLKDQLGEEWQDDE